MAKKKSKKKNSPKHKTPAQRAKLASELLNNLEKLGELNPEHLRAFNHLIDDIAPPIPTKKK